MKYKELLAKVRELPAFRFRDLKPREPLLPHEYVQIYRWVKEGRLIRLRQNLYTLNNEERKSPVSPLWLSAQLYWPSYISLEHALSFYGLIPEAAYQLTCVTTLKTKTFKNAFGGFSYHTIQPGCFFGYRTMNTAEKQSFWIADPEKALLDFVYLSIPKKVKLNKELFLENYRLQNLDQLKITKLRNYIARFDNARVQDAGDILIQLIQEERSAR